MLDSKLLKVCADEAERAKRLEVEAQQAQSAYHFAIRRLYLSGGSYREIASALGMSYQRVGQIVEANNRSLFNRFLKPKYDKKQLDCSFCGKSSHAVERLFAGPDVFICEACRDAAETVFRTGEEITKPVFFTLIDDGSKIRCSFCFRKNGKGRRIVSTSQEHICCECTTFAAELPDLATHAAG